MKVNGTEIGAQTSIQVDNQIVFLTENFCNKLIIEIHQKDKNGKPFVSDNWYYLDDGQIIQQKPRSEITFSTLEKYGKK